MPNAAKSVAFPDLADVLAAATAPASPAELAGEDAAVTSFRSVQREMAGSSWTRSPAGGVRRLAGRKAALVAAGAFGLMSLSGAAAAAGSLPDAAQDVAHEALTKVGIDVPRGKGLATAPGQLKDKDKGADKPAKADPPAGTPTTGKGGTISSIAQDPTLTGAEKGAAVSAEASDGKSRAGQQSGKPAATPGGPPASVPAGPPPSLPAGPPASTPAVTAPGKAKAATAGAKAPEATPAQGARP